MNCIEEGLLQMYIDDEVSKKERKQIRQHLESCEACQHALEKQHVIKSSVIEAINALAEPTITLEDFDKPKIVRLPMKRIVYAISAASVLLIGIALLKNYQKSEIDQPQIYYELDWSVDANKPITDQDFVINMYEMD